MEKYTLLLIDDEIDNLELLARTFRNKYNMVQTSSAKEALNLAKENSFDLVISDHKMPEMSGIDLLSQMKEINPAAVRILITAYTDVNSMISAINTAKIYKYIKKPWNPEDLLNVVESALEIYQLKKDNDRLIQDVSDLLSGTISAITEALDAKDSFTSGRSRRVTFYSTKIAEKMGFNDKELGKIELAGHLHDIGMIGVPEHIINKPTNLTPEEFDIIKTHVEQGVRILEDIKQLKPIVEIIKYHHERYDGNGYPYGLKGDDIPLASRIIAIADAYDGMVSTRAYRNSMSKEEAIEKILHNRGLQFDPDVTDVFMSIIHSAAEELINKQEYVYEE